jgi:thiosulfate reductase cytochrome b subunit
MWLLMINGLCYLFYGVATGRFRRKLFPIRPREVISNIRDALRFRLSHDDLTRYNAVQKLLYVGIILVIIVQVLSGLAVWKPVQFSELASLFYSFQGSRLVHFIGMAAIVAFLVIHVMLALIVPKTIGAMITGGPPVHQDEQEPGAGTASRASTG